MPQPSISETEIANRALVRIGASRITDINDASTEKGAAAATLYQELRDALLRRYRWNFARTWKSLAQLSTAPLNLALLNDPDYAGRIIYTAAYQLPVDFVRLSAVSPNDSHWRIVGRQLYTDAPGPAASSGLIGLQPGAPVPGSTATGGVGVGIEYIAKVSDVTQWDPLFAQILALQLAYSLCPATNAMLELRRELRDEYKNALADIPEGMEQWPEQLYDTVMVDVRYGYTSGAGSLGALA